MSIHLSTRDLHLKYTDIMVERFMENWKPQASVILPLFETRAAWNFSQMLISNDMGFRRYIIEFSETVMTNVCHLRRKSLRSAKSVIEVFN
jgi:hypothetical protein